MDIVRVVSFVLWFSIAAGPPFAAYAGSETAHHRHWGYEGKNGPEYWWEMEKENAPCKLGKEQSPINITGSVKSDLPAIRFNYKPTALKVVNNGHTIQVNYDKSSSIKVGDKSFDLVQFHFHTPSEEQINGKPYEMVWHLVHKSAEGKLGVVGVLVKQGKRNDAINAIAANLPEEQGKEHAATGVSVNAANLLPSNRGYYHFMGSLTTPPCSEGVSWYVLKEPVEASTEQIAKFKALFGKNARPVQPLHTRMVKESK